MYIRTADTLIIQDGRRLRHVRVRGRRRVGRAAFAARTI